MPEIEINKSLKFSCNNQLIKIGYCFVLPNQQSINDKIKHLHPSELLRFNNAPSNKRATSYLLGRYAAKKAYQIIDSSIEPSQIFIDKGIAGFPIFPGEIAPNTRISISHTNNAAAALCFNEKYLIEIDIEKIESSMATTIEDTLSPAEKYIIYNQNLNRNKLLFHFWSAKEALSKIFRTGLAIPYNTLEVESTEVHDKLIISKFCNFDSFIAYSQIIENHIVTIVSHNELVPSNLQLW